MSKQEEINNIEFKIACHHLTPEQVFTQMLQLINSDIKENEYRAKIIDDRDGVIKEQRKDLYKIYYLLTDGLPNNYFIDVARAEEISGKYK